MKTLVIPDIHNDYKTADTIIHLVPHDRVVFLGDYFDQFDDTPADVIEMAKWLKERMDNYPDDVFLIGNHDVPYMWTGVEKCSGFTQEKAMAIYGVFDPRVVRRRMKLHDAVDGWLLSHAGLSLQLVSYWAATNMTVRSAVRQFLGDETDRCMEMLDAGHSHYLIRAGRDRGGFDNHGGITWCDWDSFRPIPGLKQLVGHSRGKSVRIDGDNWCIDTGLQHYAVIEDGELTVGSFEELVKMVSRHA